MSKDWAFPERIRKVDRFKDHHCLTLHALDVENKPVIVRLGFDEVKELIKVLVAMTLDTLVSWQRKPKDCGCTEVVEEREQKR